MLILFTVLAASAFLATRAHAKQLLATSYDDVWDATGHKLDPKKSTAAHKTWPLGSIWTLSCKASRRSVVVTINDRGPFVAHRDLDLPLWVDRALRCHGMCRVEAAPWPPLPRPNPRMEHLATESVIP
jgi:hypothetical protein